MFISILRGARIREHEEQCRFCLKVSQLKFVYVHVRTFLETNLCIHPLLAAQVSPPSVSLKATFDLLRVRKSDVSMQRYKLQWRSPHSFNKMS